MTLVEENVMIAKSDDIFILIGHLFMTLKKETLRICNLIWSHINDNHLHFKTNFKYLIFNKIIYYKNIFKIFYY